MSKMSNKGNFAHVGNIERGFCTQDIKISRKKYLFFIEPW